MTTQHTPAATGGDPSPPHAAWSVATGAAGAAALGACFGLKAGIGATLTMAALMPLVIGGVVCVTVPGLYVSTTMLGHPPKIATVAQVWFRAARDIGVVMLGLTPAALFLVASLPYATDALIIGMGAITLSVIVAARSLFDDLREVFDASHMRWIFPVWLVVASGLGFECMMMALDAGGLR